ncbi:MAG: hypothetical protein GQ565_05200 [Candidatus Aegiribacteria sp.]|nr:hypothetical protein [Candidatus Aegiribacteria sp.]
MTETMINKEVYYFKDDSSRKVHINLKQDIKSKRLGVFCADASEVSDRLVPVRIPGSAG